VGTPDAFFYHLITDKRPFFKGFLVWDDRKVWVTCLIGLSIREKKRKKKKKKGGRGEGWIMIPFFLDFFFLFFVSIGFYVLIRKEKKERKKNNHRISSFSYSSSFFSLFSSPFYSLLDTMGKKNLV